MIGEGVGHNLEEAQRVRRALSHPLGNVVARWPEPTSATCCGRTPRCSTRHELEALARLDDRERPPSWRLSPWAVVTYLMGGELADGTVVTPKYVGRRRLIEIAVATLATDRALLLLGVPGTAKTWVSEHLAAAISGDSTLLVQGTAGTTEETLRYGWNYARLIAEGPTEAALVPSPVYRAMQVGLTGPRRGADPHALRRAGRARHGAVREDDAGPRAGDRGAGRRAAST